MVITVGLQDISFMYITLETSYVFISYYSSIKLTGFCYARHTSNRQSFKKVTCPFNEHKGKEKEIERNYKNATMDPVLFFWY